jgi:hypothetical protein
MYYKPKKSNQKSSDDWIGGVRIITPSNWIIMKNYPINQKRKNQNYYKKSEV